MNSCRMNRRASQCRFSMRVRRWLLMDNPSVHMRVAAEISACLPRYLDLLETSSISHEPNIVSISGTFQEKSICRFAVPIDVILSANQRNNVAVTNQRQHGTKRNFGANSRLKPARLGLSCLGRCRNNTSSRLTVRFLFHFVSSCPLFTILLFHSSVLVRPCSSRD